VSKSFTQINPTEMGQPFACCNTTKPYILQRDKVDGEGKLGS
jgi:hypothetical protein